MSNLLLFITFSLFFGLLLTLQVYDYNHPSCTMENTTASASSGVVDTIVGLFVPACPACLSLAALLLPAGSTLGLVQFIADYGTW
ncbi:MAG: hypothetical protein ABEI52_03405, partial [Halobacteriaceae archaeon]